MKALQTVLCADIGTSSIKLSLIDFDGKQHGFARESFPYGRTVIGKVRSSDWKEAFRRGIVPLKKCCSGAEIKALVISGNGPTLVPVTHSGKKLPPLYWYDKRIYTPPELEKKSDSFFLPRAAWVKYHAADKYDDVAFFLSSQEWLSWELGAEPVTVLPSPSYIPFYWDDDQLRMYDLDSSKFAPFAELGSGIGKVSAEAASYFDLPQGTPIVAGGPDYIMALIGTGTIESGMVCDRAGTSEGINLCTGSPVYASELRTLPHIKNGLWNVSSLIPHSGKLFEWFRNVTEQNDRPYEDMMKEIIADQGFDCSASKTDFFSHLDGSHFIPFVQGSSNSTTDMRPRLGRAIVESIGFMVLDALQSFKQKGFSITEMRVSGGQAKSPLWNQLKANISGCTLHVPEIADAELAGNAALVLIHLREAADINEASQKVVRIKESYYSDPVCHGHYVDQFKTYSSFIDIVKQSKTI